MLVHVRFPVRDADFRGPACCGSTVPSIYWAVRENFHHRQDCNCSLIAVAVMAGTRRWARASDSPLISAWGAILLWADVFATFCA